MEKEKITYKDSGVDIREGEKMVESIKSLVKETHSDAVLHEIGGFGGFFMPDLSDFEKPVFVSSVDGVGTKLIVAFKMEQYDTVGQDLVNHCINDIAVCGADPLFFLDYFSTGTLKKEVGYEIVKGFTHACKQNGVALVGGETAEMPDIYSKGEFDLAGTIVGIVEKEKIIDGSDIENGDLLIGFKSSGLHTNGYSLARKVLFSEYTVDDYVERLETTVGEELLKVHRSYLPFIKQLREVDGVNGFSHITGGGILGNTKRVVPDRFNIEVDWDAWHRPPVFELIKEMGNVPEEDMRATFNLGFGLVMVISPSALGTVEKWAEEQGESLTRIGKIK